MSGTRLYRHRLLLMLDEFATLGRLDFLQTQLSYLPGYGIKAFLIVQDLSQLYAAYGRHESIVSNSDIRVAYAPTKVETARPVSAQRALEIGLLNGIVEPAQLLATALETADANAANAPLAVAATRRGVRELLALPLAEAYRRQEEIGGPPRRSEDSREAQRAFLEKRRPVWKGR